MTIWPQKKIEEIAEKVGMGPFGSSIKVSTFVDKGIPIIGTPHLSSVSVDSSKEFNFISEQHAEKLHNSLVHKGDLILTHRGNIGQAAYIKDNFPFMKMMISQSQFFLRPDQSKILPAFLAYFFKTRLGQHLLLANASQVGVPAIARPVSYLKTIKIPVPSLKEQNAIVHQLEIIDQKIELNQQMNETLEEMAQTIFKDWFVDFGPTRRKMEGATDPAVIIGGLLPDPEKAADIARLFPSKLDNNGLPDKWRYSTAGKRFDIKIGRTPPRKENWHFTKEIIGVPWLSIRDLAKCGMYIHQTSEGLTPQSIKDCKVPLVGTGTVLVSFKLTVGRVAIAEREMATNEAIAHLNPTESSPSSNFAYCWMKNFDYSSLGSTSSIATAINSKIIKEMHFPKFSVDVEDQFALLTKPFFELILNNSREIRTLSATRDLLLPKLISGEIHLRDMERINDV